jgi:hypothetical protein
MRGKQLSVSSIEGEAVEINPLAENIFENLREIVQQITE